MVGPWINHEIQQKVAQENKQKLDSEGLVLEELMRQQDEHEQEEYRQKIEEQEEFLKQQPQRISVPPSEPASTTGQNSQMQKKGHQSNQESKT